MAAELEGWVYLVGTCVVIVGYRYLHRVRDRVRERTAADPLADAIDETRRDETSPRGVTGTDGDAVVDVLGGQTTAASDMTMTTESGRAFTGTELQAVERAREHTLAHPEATPRQLVAAAAPRNSVAPDRVDAYWRDVLRPGLVAFTDVDVARIENNDGSEHAVDPETDGIDRGTDANAAMRPDSDGETSVDDAREQSSSGRDGDRAIGETAHAAGTVDDGTLAPEAPDDDQSTRPATGDASSPLALADGFEVVWIDRGDEHARVTGRGHAATFALGARDGDLAVRPLDGGYRRDDGSDQDWYVDAATALEATLPDAYADLDDPNSPWSSATADSLDVGTTTDSVDTDGDHRTDDDQRDDADDTTTTEN